MYTFFIIIITLILILNINKKNSTFQNTEKAFLSILFVFTSVFFIYIVNDDISDSIVIDDDLYINDIPEDYVDEDIVEINNDSSLSEFQNFLKTKNLDYSQEFDSISQNRIFEILNSHIFKDVDLCEHMYDAQQMSNDDFKKYKNKYYKIHNDYDKFYYHDMVRLCSYRITTVVSNRRNKSVSSDKYTLKPDVNPCAISIDFIKKDLYNPSTIDYSLFDCTPEWNGKNFIVLRKISAKNNFGLKKQYIYKLTIEYLSGHENDLSSWKLIKIQSEEYN